MATSTIRVLSCSLKIWRIKCKCNYLMKVIKSLCEQQKNPTKWQSPDWHWNWLTGFLLINISSCSVTTAAVKEWVWSIRSCHQSAAHYRRLDGGNKGNSLKDKDGANWMANNNVCFHKMEIYLVTRQTPERRTGAKPLCFKLNANSILTKLTDQRGSGRWHDCDSNLAPATQCNPLHFSLCTLRDVLARFVPLCIWVAEQSVWFSAKMFWVYKKSEDKLYALLGLLDSGNRKKCSCRWFEKSFIILEMPS